MRRLGRSRLRSEENDRTKFTGRSLIPLETELLNLAGSGWFERCATRPLGNSNARVEVVWKGAPPALFRNRRVRRAPNELFWDRNIFVLPDGCKLRSS